MALDKSFAKYQLFNAVIYRHWTGARWAEGPAWSAQGQYLLWSDIPNNRQMRIAEEDGHVSMFPQSVGLQQREHVRLRRPSTLVRTRRTPRGALRARWKRDGDRRQVQRQAAEFAERRGGASRWRHLVHRPAVRNHGQLRRIPGKAGEQRGGLPGGSEDVAHRTDDGRARQAQRYLFFARLQETVRCGHGHAEGHTGVRRGRQQAEGRAPVHGHEAERKGRRVRRNSRRRGRQHLGGLRTAARGTMAYTYFRRRGSESG